MARTGANGGRRGRDTPGRGPRPPRSPRRSGTRRGAARRRSPRRSGRTPAGTGTALITRSTPARAKRLSPSDNIPLTWWPDPATRRGGSPRSPTPAGGAAGRAAGSGTCWRCSSVTTSGSVSSYSLRRVLQAHGAVGEGVLDPVGVPAVGEGDPEAVLRPEHHDRRAVHGPGAPAHVDDDPQAGQHPGQVDRDLVRDRPVEAGHAPPDAWPTRRDVGPRARPGGVRAHTSVNPPSTARTCPVM